MAKKTEIINKVKAYIEQNDFISIYRVHIDCGIHYTSAKRYMDYFVKIGFISFDEDIKMYVKRD